jgi:hypothetical protein
MDRLQGDILQEDILVTRLSGDMILITIATRLQGHPMVDLIQGNIRMGLLIINIPLNSILHTLEEALHHSTNATRHHPTRTRGLKVPQPQEEPRVDLR